MLIKPKINFNRFDLPIILGLILALLSLSVQPFGVVNAENEDLSIVSKNGVQFRANSTTVALLEESNEGRLFFPPVEVKKPDKTIKGVITFYSSTPDQTDSSPFIAADGTHVYDGMIANNCLPLFARSSKKAYVKIPSLYGDKIFTVHDRMNKRFGCNKFDIWMDAPRKELLKLGVKRAEVEIYYKNEGPTKGVARAK